VYFFSPMPYFCANNFIIYCNSSYIYHDEEQIID
jgi:hypothetical protein